MNWIDYGARMLNPRIGRWNGVDALGETQVSFTPYHYTFNNPINFIDPDGNDGIRIIDTKNKTITIRAVYFVQTEGRPYPTKSGKVKYQKGYSEKKIEKMQAKTNEYLNKLNLSVSEGEYEGYSINFDLDFEAGGTVEQSEEKAKSKTQNGHSIGNSLTVGDESIYPKFAEKEIEKKDGTVGTSTVGGITLGNKDILMNRDQDTKMNIIHEIFHTFGFKHPENVGGRDGIMKYPPKKPNQNDANELGNSDFLPKVENNEE